MLTHRRITYFGTRPRTREGGGGSYNLPKISGAIHHMTTKFSPVVDIKNSSTKIKFQVKIANGVSFGDQKLKNVDSLFLVPKLIFFD